jgi:hypothetical protein
MAAIVDVGVHLYQLRSTLGQWRALKARAQKDEATVARDLARLPDRMGDRPATETMAMTTTIHICEYGLRS